MILTFEQAEAVHDEIYKSYPELYAPLRRIAAERLVIDGWDEIGTSDTSIQLTEMLRIWDVPNIGPFKECYAACGFEFQEDCFNAEGLY